MRWMSLVLSLVAVAVAVPSRAEQLVAGAGPEQRLTPTCLAYPRFVVMLLPDADTGGEGVAIRPRRPNEVLDEAVSCHLNDPTILFRTQPHGSSHFAGMVGDVALIADEEVRKSLFAYELPSGKELFVARQWEKGEVDPKARTLSFQAPANAKDCETALRAQELAAPACKKRVDEAAQCLRASNERYAKTPAKVTLATSKNGKGCRFDFVERFQFDAGQKKLTPTGEVAVSLFDAL